MSAVRQPKVAQDFVDLVLSLLSITPTFSRLSRITTNHCLKLAAAVLAFRCATETADQHFQSSALLEPRKYKITRTDKEYQVGDQTLLRCNWEVKDITRVL